MSTLSRINGECVSVPGLRIYGRRSKWGGMTRFAIIAEDSRGATELWTVETGQYSGEIGGVEAHSRTPQYGDHEPIECDILPGGCYHDGSSLAWSETFAPMVHAGDSEGVMRELIDWHKHNFGS